MARGHYLAGLITLDAGDIASAEKAFAKTVELNEQHAGGWAQLARLYLLAGEFIKGEGCLANAVSTTRGNANVSDLVGTVCRLAGKHDASRDWHQRAVESAPDHVPFRINLANAELFVGELEAARVHIDKCLKREPDNPLVHWLLSRAVTAESDDHIRQMEDLLSKTGDLRASAYLNYAAGKEYEDLQKWDSAFDAYRSGADARRQCIAYDEAEETELFDRMSSLFTNQWHDAKRSDCRSNVPVFIIGQPRTGTTLLDRMLDAHPAVASAGELRHFGLALRRVAMLDEPRQYTPKLMEAAAAADTTALGELYVAGIAGFRGRAAHVVDKLPSNFHFLPVIITALPNAKILHVRRDPMDTCFAVYKQLFAGAYLHSYDLGEMARHFVRYARWMATMRTRFGDRFLDVQYEDLVTDTEECLRRVLDYVGLSWNAACLDYSNQRGVTATQSAAQVREAPHGRSIGRWKRYEQQLKPLRRALDNAGLLGVDDFDTDRGNS